MAHTFVPADGYWNVAANWDDGLVPVAGNTCVMAGKTIRIPTGYTTDAIANLTNAVAGGNLIIEGTGAFKSVAFTGWNSNTTVTMAGSGDLNNPSKLIPMGAWTVGGGGYNTAQIQYTTMDRTSNPMRSDVMVDLSQSAAAWINWNGAGFYGRIDGLLFYNGIGGALYGINTKWYGNDKYTGILSNLLFDTNSSANVVTYGCSCSITGIWDYRNLTGILPIQNNSFYGSGRLNHIHTGGTTVGRYYMNFHFGTVYVHLEHNGPNQLYQCRWYENSYCESIESSIGATLTLPEMYENSSCKITFTGAAAIAFGTSLRAYTTGLIEVIFPSGSYIHSFCSPYAPSTWQKVKITAGTANIYMISSAGFTVGGTQTAWRSNPQVDINIVSCGKCRLLNDQQQLVQTEPWIERRGTDHTDHRIHWAMQPKNPDLTVYPVAGGTYPSYQSGWTWATDTYNGGTLANNGYITMYALAFNSGLLNTIGLALANVDTEGTFSIVAGAGAITFFLSPDGGINWTAELTLAQFQAGVYTVAGQSRVLLPGEQWVMGVKLKNTNGSTATLRSTGHYDPVVLRGLSVDSTVTSLANEEYYLKTILADVLLNNAAITAVKADTAASLVNENIMMNKVGSAGYDRTTDSLEAVSDKITTIPAGLALDSTVAKDATVAKAATLTAGIASIISAITNNSVDLTPVTDMLNTMEKRLRTEIEYLRSKITELINSIANKFTSKKG